MTDRERFRRGLGLAVLIHAALVGLVLWLWNRPASKAKPPPLRWDVSVFERPRPAVPPPPAAEPPPPDLAAEPAAAEPAPPSAPPPLAPAPAGIGAAPPAPGPSPLVGAPAFSAPKFAMPSGEAGTAAFGPGAAGGTGGTGTGGAAPPRQLPPPPGADGPGGGLAALVRVPPAYPLDARRRKIEGWVRLEFTVREDGSVADVAVRKGEPAGIFDQAAIAAIGQWKFRPAEENGKPVQKRAAQTLRFELKQ